MRASCVALLVLASLYSVQSVSIHTYKRADDEELTLSSSYTTSYATQVCADEFVNIDCEVGLVVEIQEAWYGRMALGRCIRDNSGYIGCKKDVTDVASQACTGVMSCPTLPGTAFPSVFGKPEDCEDEESYLEITWTCVSQPVIIQTEGKILPLETVYYERKEYCENEMFRADCSSGQTIEVIFAHYGRMSLGKCIQENVGDIGCSIDVSELLYNLCAGKAECRMSVSSDSVQKNIDPCPGVAGTRYLEASFKCV